MTKAQVALSALKLLWGVALGLLIAVVWYPVGNGLTRMLVVGLSAIVWFGLLALCWRNWWWRAIQIAITAGGGLFLLLPGRHLPPRDTLAADYIAALGRYEGAIYIWGGENGRGIDCSGLVRRGLVDACFWRGLRTLDPGLVRHALSLWWHDSTARAMSEEAGGWTVRVQEAPALSTLDESAILPGDLAVTRDGIHVLVYLGQRRWQEADPVENRVVTLQRPAADSNWFHTPMKIVRWSVLRP